MHFFKSFSRVKTAQDKKACFSKERVKNNPSYFQYYIFRVYVILCDTVGKKSIRALEIFRVQKLILNATS